MDIYVKITQNNSVYNGLTGIIIKKKEKTMLIEIPFAFADDNRSDIVEFFNHQVEVINI